MRELVRFGREGWFSLDWLLVQAVGDGDTQLAVGMGMAAMRGTHLRLFLRQTAALLPPKSATCSSKQAQTV